MMPHLMTSTKKYLVIFIVLVLFSTISIPVLVQAKDLNEINVLLLNGRSDNENAVTMSSPSGLLVTTSNGTPFSIEAKANEKIAFQFDRFTIQLLETTNLSKIEDLRKKVEALTDTNIKPTIEMMNKKNQNYYRLMIGGLSSLEETQSLVEYMKNKLGLTADVVGPYHIDIGQFSNVSEAMPRAKELEAKGFDAYIVNVLEGNQWKVQVWVGGASTTGEALKLEQAIRASFPKYTIRQANVENYVIYKQRGLYSNGKMEIQTLLSFSTSSIIQIKPKDNQSTLLIKERSYQGNSNTYRGEISIQIYNELINIVNKLPLESYLYGVVGSEMYRGWPLEALKSQAIAARTFAYSKLLYPRSKIADIYDTTDDQAYYGTAQEDSNILKAVDETKGLVVLQNGKPISTFYSSNAGGITSAGSEVWGSDIPYTSVKESPNDQAALDNVKPWYQIIRSTGEIGYIRNDFIDIENKMNEIGLHYGVLNGDQVNFRTGPSIYYFSVIATLPIGEEIVILDTVDENNQYSWMAGPFTAEYITQNANVYQLDTASTFTRPILDLKVSSRGPSGRVMLLADGNKPIPVKYPDYYRTLLGGLTNGVQSTLFDIEQAGRIEVIGAGAKHASIVDKKNDTYVQSIGSKASLASANQGQSQFVILGTNNQLRVATKDPTYILHGKGLGHGIGMSQWGAKGLADSGYTYQQILKYYYNNIVIKKIY